MNYFIAALRKYADFNGRARRKEYWYFVLFFYILIFLAAFFGRALHIGLGLYFICVLGCLVPGIAVAVRRMHDVGKSGWYCIIPIYNLILACTDGTKGTNEYGPDPKRPEFEEFLSDNPSSAPSV